MAFKRRVMIFDLSICNKRCIRLNGYRTTCANLCGYMYIAFNWNHFVINSNSLKKIINSCAKSLPIMQFRLMFFTIMKSCISFCFPIVNESVYKPKTLSLSPLTDWILSEYLRIFLRGEICLNIFSLKIVISLPVSINPLALTFPNLI